MEQTTGMDPIGLTRAEEAKTLPAQPPARKPAPAGTPSCRITTLPEGKACGAVATVTIKWPDGDKTPACAPCARRMSQIARTQFHSDIAVSPLEAR